MSRSAETDLPDLFDAVLESVAAVLGATDDSEADSDLLPDLRDRLAELSIAADDATIDELLDTAGLSEDDELADAESLPEVLASADAASIGSLRTLLDLADLGEDAPEDDDAFLDRLGAVGDDTGWEIGGGDEGSDAAETADDDGVFPTVPGLFDGASSFVGDLLESRGSDEDADDEEKDGLLDVDDLGPDSDEEGDAGKKRQGRNVRGRFSTVPRRRTDIGRSGRFSTIKGRTKK